MPNDTSHRKPLFRLALFLASAILILLAFYILSSFTNTLTRLDIVEAERDTWQRPQEVVRALALREGNTVVDLGSGAGYFALKLSAPAGKRGQVLAVDVRKLSLFFLSTRALLRGQTNVHVIIGKEDDPRLPAGAVDAVLICNTYHEFRDPGQMLRQVRQSLRPGGRIVLVDRAPHGPAASHAHEASLAGVEEQLTRNGFEISTREAHFIDRPGDDLWWLLVARLKAKNK